MWPHMNVNNLLMTLSPQHSELEIMTMVELSYWMKELLELDLKNLDFPT
jgi:hypothetical protein